MRNLAIVFLLCVVLLALPATAATVFSNGPINGTIDGWTIDAGDDVSNSFTLNSAAIVTDVNFGAWLLLGDSLTSVNWSIGLAPFGTDFGTGTADTSIVGGTTTFLDTFTIANETFSFTGIPLTAGTYYLSLALAVTAGGNPVYWDENDGPNSLAYSTGGVQIVDTGGGCGGTGLGTGTCSESFEILGTTPEPSTWALLGSGILAALALRRRIVRR